MRQRIILLVFLCAGHFESQAQLFGGQIKRVKGNLTALVCGSVVNSGSLYAGSTATGFTAFVPYTGGNGSAFIGQTVTSTGVTGLTATASQQILAVGSGFVTYTITGIPSAAGTASFAISVGGQACTITATVLATSAQYPVGSVFCASGPSAVVDVTNPTTGKTWMNRNLGATQVATSSTNAAAYGDLYQWGRRSDGHQCRTSTTTATLSTVDQPANGNFILAPNAPNDWRSPQNANLWQGVNGVNNPCPNGYRIPTQSEVIDEKSSWGGSQSSDAFNAPLKFTLAGFRSNSSGGASNVGQWGFYWTSTIANIEASYTMTVAFGGNTYISVRAYGSSVRCIKETPATIGSLNCGSINVAGNLISGQAVSGVNIIAPYTGGNGGYYAAQTIPSTGVTGLIATLSAGLLANGSGNLVYTVTGTPSAVGIANFAINVGGQICSFSVTIQSLVSQYPAGSVFCAAGATAIVDVTNPTTGKTWMDRNLGAAQVATSSSDVNAYGDLYQWGRRSDGHQCRTSATTTTLSSTDQPGNGNFILSPNTPTDWRSPQNINLWQGVNGVNNPCPSGYRIPTETELNNEQLSWSNANANGAITSPLKLPIAGFRNSSSGQIQNGGNSGYYWSSTVISTDTRYLNFNGTTPSVNLPPGARATSLSVRCIKETVATVGALNCGSASTTGNLFSGQAAAGVSISVPYTGGNGGFYSAQNVSSSGVTGLTATISSGLVASGSGTLVYSISGTPSNDGIASFNIAIGGQFCSFTVTVYGTQPAYPIGSVFCASGATIVVDVTNPITGKTWMDRNLGATQAATSSTDAAAYGDLYQWGRRSDGHQCRTSATTATLSSSDQPGSSSFILVSNTPYDWRNPQNDNLWQGENGVNNPCPDGYRIPSLAEVDAERLSWTAQNSSGAFSSVLKLPLEGTRQEVNGTFYGVGTHGYYWSSTTNGIYSDALYFTTSVAPLSSTPRRGAGIGVRCIKENVATLGVLDCSSATQMGIAYVGQIANGVSVTVSYTGGNGGFQASQVYTSTGVTGLTAALASGFVANGTGNFTFTISGTPLAAVTANFAVSIGGQSCTFFVTVTDLVAQYQAGAVFCASGPTAIVDVTNPTTGRTWMDRNLGATQAATSSTDAAAYGDLYQWGRGSDGHQCRTSATTTIQSSTDQPGNANFITNGGNWRNPNNDNLWQGVFGINNPCPLGYRLPTLTELDQERLSWSEQNSSGAFASALKFSVGGFRDRSSGAIQSVGIFGHYWTLTMYGGSNAQNLRINSANATFPSDYKRANGTSVRCIKTNIATFGAINCGGSTQTGNVYSGLATSGVSVSLPYTGGNGGFQATQVYNSSGITGLTATLSSGFVTNGSGNLLFTIAGTPSATGTANFAVNIGGQSCTFFVTVTDLVAQYPAGSVFCASGPTAIVDVTNPTTGKIWMDRNLGASQVATSSTDAAAYGDLYQWGRGSDGHQCRTSATTATLSSVNQPGNGSFILAPNTPFDWRSPQNVNLWQGVNGINNPCPSGYKVPTTSELESERLSWISNNYLGAFSSALKLPVSGRRFQSSGLLLDVGTGGNYYTSSINLTFIDYLLFDVANNNALITLSNRAMGMSVRCIKETVAIIGALNCGGSTQTGNVYSGLATSGVSVSLPYTGGNGGFQATQVYNSLGVTGLTATLSSVLIANGSGNLVFTIAGTASATGTANFAVSVGGQSCSFTVAVQVNLVALYPANSVFCASGPTAIVDVTNPTTGKIWMDRNLGASQAATSSTDAAAYGDLYQWGRGNDGHQCRTSATTTTLSATDTPANANFIRAPSAPRDWRSPQNSNLWQGLNGVNNPCPTGYRLPTETEINAERLSWVANTGTGAFTSPLKLPMAGDRDYTDGSLGGSVGAYWSSTVIFPNSSTKSLRFVSNNAYMDQLSRAYGFTVRCLKD